MLNFSANISTLFTELPFIERPLAAAAAGFKGIEIQFPYSSPMMDLASACAEAKVECVLINIPAGDFAAGELGLACLPGREKDFADAVALAIEYARALGCVKVNCLAGNIPEGQSRQACWQVLVENVRFAVERLAEEGIQLLVEVLNNVDWPLFALGTTRQGDALIEVVAHSNLALQYDVYHRRAAGDDWLGDLIERIDRIAHIQFSDYPGRHEPGTGNLDIAKLFEQLQRLPYSGWVGCEYTPSVSTLESFGWRSAGEL